MVVVGQNGKALSFDLKIVGSIPVPLNKKNLVILTNTHSSKESIYLLSKRL